MPTLYGSPKDGVSPLFAVAADSRYHPVFRRCFMLLIRFALASRNVMLVYEPQSGFNAFMDGCWEAQEMCNRRPENWRSQDKNIVRQIHVYERVRGSFDSRQRKVEIPLVQCVFCGAWFPRGNLVVSSCPLWCHTLEQHHDIVVNFVPDVNPQLFRCVCGDDMRKYYKKALDYVSLGDYYLEQALGFSEDDPNLAHMLASEFGMHPTLAMIMYLHSPTLTPDELDAHVLASKMM